MTECPALYVTIGPAGAGKSTFVNRMKGVDVISTDQLRKEMFGSEADQHYSGRVFKAAHEMTRRWLDMGLNVVFDATHTTEKGRKDLLAAVSGVNCRKVALLFMVSPVECKRRNAQRERKVPEDVIDRQYRQFLRDAHSIPEQFDEIVVIEK